MRQFTIRLQGQGPYAGKLKDVEKDIKEIQKRINEKLGTLPIIYSLILCLRESRRQGVGHWACSSQLVGSCRRQTKNGRRTSFAGRPLHQDYPQGP